MNENIPKLLEDWYARPLGELILEDIQQELSKALEKLFGYNLLQIGPVRNRPLFAGSTIVTQLYTCEFAGGSVNLITKFEELPVNSDSVDVVLGHHLLEFSSQPHRALREIHRILTPQGHLFLIGFNPYSIIGLGHFALKLSGFRLWKTCNQLSAGRIKDWLDVLGFEIMHIDGFCFFPKLGNGILRKFFDRSDSIAKNNNLPFPGIFVIHAIKSVAGISMHSKKSLSRKSIIRLPTASPSASSVLSKKQVK